MLKTFILNEGNKLTEEQRLEIKAAKEYPIEYDEDCPKLSPEMQKAFQCVVIQRNRRKRA